MSTEVDTDIRGYNVHVNDYRTLKPTGRKNTKTFVQLTMHQKRELLKKLQSGHRLCARDDNELSFISEYGEAGFFNYMNPYPLQRLIKATLRAVEGFHLDPGVMQTVTVIYRKWNTTLEDFNLNIVAMRSKICQELRDKDALLMVEAAFLDQERVSMHCQGIIWSQLSDDDHEKINAQFDTGIKNVKGFTKGFVTVPVYEPVGAVAYMFKPPTYAYRKPVYNGAHKTKRLRNRDCYRLYKNIFGIKEPPLTYFDLMIGVGQGVQMKAAIMKYLGV